MPKINQKVILDSLAEYAQDVMKRPELARRLRNSEGFCSGFTTLWIYALLMGEAIEKNIKNNYELIVSGSQKDKSEVYEKILRYIDWLQLPQTGGLGLIQEDVERLLEGSFDSQPLYEEHQFGWVMDDKTLRAYLKLALDKGSAVYLNFALEQQRGSHAVGFVNIENKLYFYDANKDVWKTLCNNLDEVMREIYFARQRFQKKPPPYFGVVLSTLRSTSITNVKREQWDAFENSVVSHPDAFKNIHEVPKLACLHMLSKKGCTAVIKKLLEKHGSSININQASAIGATPLYIAAEKGHIDTVNLLIEKGANVNQANNNEVTPLLIAAYHGHTKVVESLLNSKADPMIETSAKVSILLDLALRQDCFEEVEMFLKSQNSGAIPDKIKGFTALHFAVFLGHEQTVAILLTMLPDIQIESLNFLIQMAQAMNQVSVFNLLKERSKQISEKNETGLDFIFFSAKTNTLQPEQSDIKKDTNKKTFPN